jgi:hypothetical protein
VTPQLGKRKRGSTHVQADEDDGELDELSPDHEELVRSIKRSRRVVETVSPIREEADDSPDELSTLVEGASTARKSIAKTPTVLEGTPASMLARKRISSGNTRAKSTEAVPVTSGLLPNGRATTLSSHVSPKFATPGIVPEEESEDELATPQANSTTPRIVARETLSAEIPPMSDDMDVDELSSIQPTPVDNVADIQEERNAQSKEQAVLQLPAKRGRPRLIVQEEGVATITASTPSQPAKHGRPANVVKAKAVATPIASKPGRQGKRAVEADVEADDQLDELSPDHERTGKPAKKFVRRDTDAVQISDEEESDAYEEPDFQEVPAPTPEPAAKRRSPKQAQQTKALSGDRRHKFLGPKHAISVMRIKGSAVRGITVADTTRTILEETIDHRLNRMAEKMQTAQDSARRKELRSEINLSLSFQESLNEKLLDLQDANDVLSINSKKTKLFRRDNAELRKEILSLQNSRQEVALEHDDVQMDFEAEKAKIEARNKLSDDMFDIEAAIQRGRDKARKEGREDEGPEVPLSMLLSMVADEVGSLGGGLLSNVHKFNGALERAAGWLEGRS